MKDAKNAQWISVFEYVLKLLRWSEPNAFGMAELLVYPKPFVNVKSVGLRSAHRILDVVGHLDRNVKLNIIW